MYCMVFGKKCKIIKIPAANLAADKYIYIIYHNTYIYICVFMMYVWYIFLCVCTSYECHQYTYIEVREMCISAIHGNHRGTVCVLRKIVREASFMTQSFYPSIRRKDYAFSIDGLFSVGAKGWNLECRFSVFASAILVRRKDQSKDASEETQDTFSVGLVGWVCWCLCATFCDPKCLPVVALQFIKRTDRLNLKPLIWRRHHQRWRRWVFGLYAHVYIQIFIYIYIHTRIYTHIHSAIYIYVLFKYHEKHLQTWQDIQT